MKAKLTLNGKEYEVKLTEEQVTEIENTNKPKTGFEYSGFGTGWYTSGLLTNTHSEPKFSDEGLCEDYARAVNLFLKLSQWQALNDEPVSRKCNSYHICFDSDHHDIAYKVYSNCHCFDIGFNKLEKIEQAIRLFYKELMWYFTEFKPRLDM